MQILLWIYYGSIISWLIGLRIKGRFFGLIGEQVISILGVIISGHSPSIFGLVGYLE